jgi:hypothetical protein
MSHMLRARCDLTTLLYREPTKLAPRVCLLLIAGTSLVLSLAVVDAIGVVL